MRRTLALLGFLAVLALALTLLWQVFRHHEASERYEREPDVVWLDAPAESSVKFARALR